MACTLLPRGPRTMPSTYTLWLLSDTSSEGVLMVPELQAGVLGRGVIAEDESEIQAFLATHGMPSQIVANLWLSVSRARQADARLFRVPATVLKPKELVGSLIKIVMTAHRK